MLDLPAIARLEEERIAVGVARVSDEAVPFAGGMMCFAGVGTWASQAYGVGMNGPVDAAEVDAMIDFYTSRGCEPRVEVSAYAHQTLLDALAARSFVLREFASVLVRDLRDRRDLPPLPPGVEVRVVDPADEVATNRFVELQLEGFRPPGPEAFAALIRRVIADDSCHCLIASIDGTDAGVAGVTVYKHSGCLIAGTTLEAHRRRGVQTALIIERLRIARDAGCTHICVGSSPTVATGRNAIRLGFVPAYTKATLVHPRPGLVPSE